MEVFMYQKVVEIMGRRTMRTGVNKQCTAQIIDMLIAKSLTTHDRVPL